MSHRGSRWEFASAFVGLALAALMACGTAAAQVPARINFKGQLTNPGGTPVTNPGLPMTFKIYNVASGGAALFTEAQVIAVNNGLFDVTLGSSVALTLPFDVPYYLGVTVGSDAEMTPRQPVLSSPYALNAAALATTATVQTSQLFGTIDATQIAVGAVTQAKLSAPGGTAGKVLGTDGANLQWQPGPPPAPVISTFTGFANVIAAGPTTAYTFVGPTTLVSVPANGRITSSASAPLATTSGNASLVVSICYQVGAGPLFILPTGNFQVTTVTPTPTMVSTHSSKGNLAAGSYTVGFCVVNQSAVAIDKNDWVNGWVMVTAS